MLKIKELLFFLLIVCSVVVSPTIFTSCFANKPKPDPIAPISKKNVIVTVNKQTKFTFKALKENVPNLKYRNSMNNVWKIIHADESLVLEANNVYEFKGSNKHGFYNKWLNQGASLLFKSDYDDGDVAISGNIMGLINDGQDSNDITIPPFSSFQELFAYSSDLRAVSQDFLTPTVLPQDCYKNMFVSTSITVAPQLPAMILGDNCYNSMFKLCNLLTTAPRLPATTLAPGCYEHMFDLCSSLTIAPELPAKSLEKNCYTFMFANCTNLKNSPDLLIQPSSLLLNDEHDWCSYMFYNCTKLTDAGKITCNWANKSALQGAFSNCTSLIKGPDITISNNAWLFENSFSEVFKDCINLESIKLDFNNKFETNYFNNWMLNVSPTGTFYYNGSDKTVGASAVPEGWTIVPF